MIGGFAGIVVGGLVGGKLGFTLGNSNDPCKDGQMLTTLAGIVIGGYAGGTIGGTLGMIPGALNLIASPFKSIVTTVASVASNVNITGTLGVAGHAVSGAAQVAWAAAPMVAGVAVTSAILGTLGYMAYNYVKKEQKNTELQREDLAKEEKKLEQSYKKLEQMISTLSDETQNKELHGLHTKFMEEYQEHGEIRITTVNDMRFKYNEIMKTQKKPVCEEVATLGSAVLESVSRCHKLREAGKSFAEKFVDSIIGAKSSSRAV